MNARPGPESGPRVPAAGGAPRPSRGAPARPVLYLDVDDVLVNWGGHEKKPAAGAAEFLRWALATHEVRWLTRRCPSGRMPDETVRELAELSGVEADRLHAVRGLDWETCESKLNGIAWLEHLVLGRPFIWVEDEYGVGELELAFLDEHGCRENYFHCNVSTDPDALVRVHRRLSREAGGR